MQTKFAIILFSSLLPICFAPPVTQNKKENESPKDSGYGGLEDYMEYHRYLKEVVNALESDPDFRQKLEKADEKEIKSGKIADELQFVSHHVRSRLDEIKRVELQRLRDLVERKLQLEEDENLIDEDHDHLDDSNPHTFEIEDLKKLIKQTTQDLAEADKMRREEFKQYELEKEYQKQEKLNHTNGNDRDKLKHEFQEMEQKHKKHERLHEPGHKAQLEEVWEEQDQMQQEFDPKTFFMLHDIDGNDLWDQEEVKSLFIKELDKMYQQGAPEDDMRERFEEMERMRESVFNEMDTDHDGFIDYEEFLRQTKSNNFKQDHGWQGLDEQTKPYSDEELQEYIRQHHAANQVPQAGYIPVQQLQHPAGYPQQAYQQGPSGGYQQVPPGGYQQIPPGGYQQVPPGGYQQTPPQQKLQASQVPQMPPQPLDLNTNEIHVGQPLQYQQQQPPQYHQQQPPQYQVPQQQPQYQQVPQQPPQYQQSPPQYQQSPPQYQQSPPQQAQQVPQNNAQQQPPNQQVNADPPVVQTQKTVHQQRNIQKQV